MTAAALGPLAAGWRADGGEGDLVPIDWISLLTPQTIAVLGVLLLVLLLIVVVAGALVYRKLRRSPLLRDQLLSLRSLRAQALPPGLGRDVAQLRGRLRRCLSAVQELTGLVRSRDRDAGELVLLAQRLERIGDTLDTDLAILEGAPDRPGVRELVADAESRVTELEQASGRLRETALRRDAAVSAVAIQSLNQELGQHQERVRAWEQAYRELGGGQV